MQKTFILTVLLSAFTVQASELAQSKKKNPICALLSAQAEEFPRLRKKALKDEVSNVRWVAEPVNEYVKKEFASRRELFLQMNFTPEIWILVVQYSHEPTMWREGEIEMGPPGCGPIYQWPSRFVPNYDYYALMAAAVPCEDVDTIKMPVENCSIM